MTRWVEQSSIETRLRIDVPDNKEELGDGRGNGYYSH